MTNHSTSETLDGKWNKDYILLEREREGKRESILWFVDVIGKPLGG